MGRRLFRLVMKSTFYGHFVAGEDQEMIKPLIGRNGQFGVKSILDYSVEKDISEEEAKEAEMKYVIQSPNCTLFVVIVLLDVQAQCCGPTSQLYELPV